MDAGKFDHPVAPLYRSVNALCASQGIDTGTVSAFAVRAMPCGSNTPTRSIINLYSLRRIVGCARRSMSHSLIQIYSSPRARLGSLSRHRSAARWKASSASSAMSPKADCALDITFYDEQGELGTRRFELNDGAAIRFDPEEALSWRADGGRPLEDVSYIWYTAKTERPDLTGYVVTRHRAAGHFSGDHSF